MIIVFLDMLFALQDSEEYQGTENAIGNKAGEKVSYFFIS